MYFYYHGCEQDYYKGRRLHVLCQINAEDYSERLENIKYSKAKLMVFYFELFKSM